MTDKTKLQKEAEELGINVNPRWTEETLQKKIDEALAAPGGDQQGQNSGNAGGPSAVALAGGAVADDGTALQTEETPKSSKAGVELDARTRLVITAEELNIEVDDDWDEERLRGEIQMAREGRADLQVKGAVPPAEMSKVDYDPATAKDKTVYTLQTDYWDEKGERIPAGTDLTFTDAEARRLGPNVLKAKGGVF